MERSKEQAIERLWDSWLTLLDVGERLGFAEMHETIDGLEGTQPHSLLKIAATQAVIERIEKRQLERLGPDPVLH
jgi:hypothetical protein